MAAPNYRLNYTFSFALWFFIVLLLPATGYTHLGCWRDTRKRAVPSLEGTDPRLKDKWGKREEAINKCYEVARKKKLVLFAVQAGGWCAGASNLNGYKKYGKATNCRNGKGGGWANDVYRITIPTSAPKVPTPIKGDPCADPLELNKCYRFESVNYEGDFIKHQKQELWKKPGNGLSNWRDSTWRIVGAVNGNRKYISLEALQVPGYHMRHKSFKGYITKCAAKDVVCRNDASWAVKYGFIKSTYCEKTVSFESFNVPGYHLRHAGNRLMISAFADKDLYRKDASWVYREVSCKNGFKCAAP